MKINLVAGGSYGRGHFLSQTVRVEISDPYTIEDVTAAYKLGSEMIGFDLVNYSRGKFWETNIGRENFEKLFQIPAIASMFDNDIGLAIRPCGTLTFPGVFSTIAFIGIYCAICNYGNDKLSMSVCEQIPELHIGGYALLSNLPNDM